MKDMLYKSTRGGGYVSGSDAIIKGIADDGGLFVPDHIPNISSSIYDMMEMDYREMAQFILSMFFTDFTEQNIKDCVYKSYDEKFDDINIAPLKKCGNLFFLELFHGPTLAFKDMALSILPHLLTTALKKQNNKNNVVILTATSGDTGKAALEGFTNIEGIKIIVFYPEIGVSQIQKRQMITHEGSNTYVFGIDGNFDDAQKGVKGIFNDKRFKDILYKNNYIFSSANSINIGRLIPQIVYYFYSYITLCKNKEINMGDKINIAVPTGNFGNILAAYYAKCMGLPVNKLICASNKNNVLWDFFRTGIYDKNRKFVNNEGTFNIIMKNIRFMKKHYPELFRSLTINMVLDPSTNFEVISSLPEQYPELANLIIRAGIANDYDSTTKNIHNEHFTANYFYDQFLEYLTIEHFISNPFLNNVLSNQINSENELVQKLFNESKMSEVSSPGGPCIPGYHKFFVDAKGKIYICEKVCESNAMHMGDIFQGLDLKKVNSLLNVSNLTANQCLNCWAFRLCSSCAKFADGGEELSSEKRLAYCREAKLKAHHRIRNYILMKDARQHTYLCKEGGLNHE